MVIRAAGSCPLQGSPLPGRAAGRHLGREVFRLVTMKSFGSVHWGGMDVGLDPLEADARKHRVPQCPHLAGSTLGPALREPSPEESAAQEGARTVCPGDRR